MNPGRLIQSSAVAAVPVLETTGRLLILLRRPTLPNRHLVVIPINLSLILPAGGTVIRLQEHSRDATCLHALKESLPIVQESKL